MSTVDQTIAVQKALQIALDTLIQYVGKIQIGTPEQFPLGWRNAAKGRTIWRILEELITQNLEKHYVALGIREFTVSDSEVSVYDFSIAFEGLPRAHVNVKSAVLDGPSRKDDISKYEKLVTFYQSLGEETPDFFIATFFIRFNADMSFDIRKCVAFPIAWAQESDIGINTSNNGNVQLKNYKDVEQGEKRTSKEFVEILQAKVKTAITAKEEKRKLLNPDL